MSPKPADPGWKTGEQLEFLLRRWEDFKRTQNAKTLDKFWPRVFEDWYTNWPISSSPSLALTHGTVEEGRLKLQKAKNTVRPNFYPLHLHRAQPDACLANQDVVQQQVSRHGRGEGITWRSETRR